MKLLVRVVFALLAVILCAGALQAQTGSAPTVQEAEEFMKQRGIPLERTERPGQPCRLGGG